MTLPAAFWEDEQKRLVAILQPRLSAVAAAGVTAAERHLKGLGIYFDNALAHEQAADWAAHYTDDLLAQLGTRTQGLVGPALENWVKTPGLTKGDLDQALLPLLDNNPSRADAVGVTEITRVFAEGNDIAFRAAGLPGMAFKPPAHVRCRCNTAVRRLPTRNQWVVIWLTERDGLVCTRTVHTPFGDVAGCRALHGVIISQGEYLGRKFSEVS
jgi:hypothetical protein